MATTKIRSSKQLYVDANLDLNSKKIINLTPGASTGQAVEFDQLNLAIGNAIATGSSSLHTPVADLAAAKAVTAGGITGFTDKMLMLIETLGLYRFDAESVSASNDDTVIRPTSIASDASPGRWIKMSSTITDHNLLSGKQGGITGQYYHLTAAEVSKLSGIAAGAQVNVATNLAQGTRTSTTVLITSSTGSSATLNIATTALAGLMSAADKVKLDGASAGNRIYRATPTGTVNGSNATFTIAALILSGTEEIFLNGILQNAGAGNDYTIIYAATTTITFLTAPSSTPFVDGILINYSV